MRKILLFGTMLGVASAALAFGGIFGGGSHGTKSTTYKGGVDAIGVHYNEEKKEADPQEEIACPEYSTFDKSCNECKCDEGLEMFNNTCVEPCLTWQSRDTDGTCQDVICDLNADIYEDETQVCVCPEHRDTTDGICGDCVSETSWQKWNQPILDSTHDNGIMGVDEFACDQLSYRDERKAWRAFDGTNDDDSIDCWHNTDDDGPELPTWISWYTAIPIRIKSITIINVPGGGDTEEESTTRDFELQYSDDNMNWSTLITATNPMGYSLSTTHQVNAITAHSYWRMYVLSRYNNVFASIGELIIDADTPSQTTTYTLDENGMCQVE